MLMFKKGKRSRRKKVYLQYGLINMSGTLAFGNCLIKPFEGLISAPFTGAEPFPKKWRKITFVVTSSGVILMPEMI